MYQLNKPYTKRELAEEVFEIAYKTLSNNPRMYMDYLAEYFEIRTIPNGRWEKYVLVKEKKPWITYGEKIKMENHTIIEDYRDASDVVIKENPRQTFKSISDKIGLYNINNLNVKYNHQPDTRKRNVSKAVQEYFLPKNGKWCQKIGDGEYRPMDRDELDLYYGLQEEYRAQYFDNKKTNELFKVLNQKRKNEISEKEATEKYDKIFGSWYDVVMEEFKKVYGFIPVWVREWERNGEKWNNE